MNSESTWGGETKKPRATQGALLLVGSCLPILGAVLIAPLLPQMALHFASVVHADVLVPLVLTTPALMVGLLGPFAGLVVDKFGRKTPLMVALLCYSALGTAPLWIDNLYGVLASRLGLGVAEAVIITCCTALIGDYYADESRARMLAWQTMTGSLCAAVFFFVGGLVGELGWRVPFWLYLGGILMVPCASAALWEPIRVETRHRGGTTHIAAFPWQRHAWLYVLSWCGGVSLFIVAVQLGFLLSSMGVRAPGMIGAAIGTSHAAVFAGAICSRWLGRLGPLRTLCIAFALAGGSLLALSVASSYPQVVIAVLLNGLGAGLMIPTLVAWALSGLPPELRGRGSGGFMASIYFGEFMSPLVVAGVAAVVGGLMGAIKVLGLVLLVLAATCATQWLTGRRASSAQA
ncbi:MFS transporter [Burkholderia ubonensis]|uniref:MFS transporter n=1 Tax=Burkholderia ubonensis TaxID=101571 RepID=UPI0015CB2D3F|nr:MFS transporter [Burkholderia ubonensis]